MRGRLYIAIVLYNLLIMIDLNSMFAALADPTRRAILGRLAKSEATVMELAEPFSMSQPAVSRHLKVLEQAGFIARRAEGAKRPCRLVPGSLDAMDEWLAVLRTTLATNYGHLNGVLADMKSNGREKR